MITSRIGNLTRLIHTLAICVTIHTYILQHYTIHQWKVLTTYFIDTFSFICLPLDTMCDSEAELIGEHSQTRHFLFFYFYLTYKEWTDCVQSDIRAFGIAEDWKATALKAEVWVETVTEGGRRFVAAWRKEEVDAARHRQEKREATRLENLLSQTGV